MLLKKETGKHKYSYPEFLKETRLNNESRDKMPTLTSAGTALRRFRRRFHSSRLAFHHPFRSLCLLAFIADRRSRVSY